MLVTKKVEYEDSGASYEGQFFYGLRHGWGKITFKDGAIYEGEWSFGHAEGTGTFQYMAGEVYKGGMLHNLKHGIGITTHLNKKRDEC